MWAFMVVLGDTETKTMQYSSLVKEKKRLLSNEYSNQPRSTGMERAVIIYKLIHLEKSQ